MCVRSSLLGRPAASSLRVFFAFEHEGFDELTSTFQFRTARWLVAKAAPGIARAKPLVKGEAAHSQLRLGLACVPVR